MSYENNKECKMIDIAYYYKKIGWMYIDKDEIKKAYNTIASFIFKLITINKDKDVNINDNEWFCIICYKELPIDYSNPRSTKSYEKSSNFIFLEGKNIDAFLETNSNEYVIYSMDAPMIKKLQDKMLLPILDEEYELYKIQNDFLTLVDFNQNINININIRESFALI